MSAPVRIGIIGCGAIAETHADCLSQIEGTNEIQQLVIAREVLKKNGRV